MTVRSDLLRILRDPIGFSNQIDSHNATVWIRGLDDYVVSWLASEDAPPLRERQIDAWRGMALQRLALVLGPPGTGKTFLLGTMAVGYLAARKDSNLPCRVLVCGFTREAIGNLIDSISDMLNRWAPGVPISFFGSQPEQSLADRIQIHSLAGQVQQAQARKWLDETAYCVVGATTWSLNKLFAAGSGAGPTSPVFDLVLIDEASQMLVSQGLMALSGLASEGRIVVAGDDRQLPPIRSTTAINLDGKLLGGCLYSFLRSGGIKEFSLNETFRLNFPLADYPSQTFYDGDYHSLVPSRRLCLRETWGDDLQDWERVVLDPEHPIVILLHDGPLSGTSNPFERTLIVRLTDLLRQRLMPPPGKQDLDSGTLWKKCLAVITPHRSQNSKLREDLRNIPLCNHAFVETVERIQGRERDVIIAAYAVADPEFALAEAEFLYSPQRLNVTTTRPRSKLILIVSRRLLEVLPSEEELFESVDCLREYIYDASFCDRFDWPHGQDSYSVELRVKGFPLDEQSSGDNATETPSSSVQQNMLTPSLEELLNTIRSLEVASARKMIADFDISSKLGREVLASEYRQLAELGWIRGDSRKGKFGEFKIWKTLDAPILPHPCDEDILRSHLSAIVEKSRGTYSSALYGAVRAEFMWVGDEGQDLFRPVLESLSEDGFCQLQTINSAKGQFEVVQVIDPLTHIEDDYPLVEEVLPDEDFVVLNKLEDIESRLIDIGVYETFVSISELAIALKIDRESVRQSITRLATNKWLLKITEGMVRSRIAELAREVRYLKQRFSAHDVDQRPFLVRALRLKVIDRKKPQRNQLAEPLFDTLCEELSDLPEIDTVLSGLSNALKACWGIANGRLAFAGFQLRGFEAILRSYFAKSDERSFAIAADTGSGKTEAAFLPLITAVAIDRLAGIRGVKVVAVYPRIRLVYNQAQRIVRYLSALGRQPGCPTITLGIQSGDVPRSFQAIPVAASGLWQESPYGGFSFPFFSCPTTNCESQLILLPGKGIDDADRLECPNCKWFFAGYVGTKEGIRRLKPDFLLPVTESLHQWLQDPEYGALWGDLSETPAPKALLADEIHLYSHVQGAQVGYTFQRLLARIRLNNSQANNQDNIPLAIGMSATLGDPARVWGTLISRPPDSVCKIDVHDKEQIPSVRGREYYLFVQPEIESRGHVVAGASTTIQAIMCIAHGMRRRTGQAGGYRGLAFYDSIDRVKEQLADFLNAETQKVLSRLRTKVFPGNTPSDSCCQQPESCDAFRDGECWYFAAHNAGGDGVGANDPFQTSIGRDSKKPARYVPGRPLRVMPFPVYSSVKGNVDRMIQENDLVFSTSSLEVGFDDPEMAFVYQQYAPQNLASFIQRKGRGGRGIDDRPIAGVTLSIYSPRDAWFFRHPDQMLDPRSFDTPLNMDNYFVRRGQAVSALLDAVARRRAKRGAVGPKQIGPAEKAIKRAFDDFETEIDSDANDLLELLLGKNVYQHLAVQNAVDLWRKASSEIRRVGDALSLRDLLNWVPGRLFDAINLPLLEINYEDEQMREQGRQEDVSMAFQIASPCNATRRYGKTLVHWRPLLEPYGPGDGPLFGDQAYTIADNFLDLINSDDRARLGSNQAIDSQVREFLPEDVSARLLATKRLTDHRLYRPHRLPIKVLGEFKNNQWEPRVWWDPVRERLVSNSGPGLIPLHHKTRSRMLHFPIVETQSSLGITEILRGLDRLSTEVTIFKGGPHGSTSTGLAVLHAFWGVEISLRFDRPKQEDVQLTRVFTTHNHERNLLHGYRLETEGIQLSVNSNRLDQFLDRTLQELESDDSRKRWISGQFLRYQLAAKLTALAIPSYVAGGVADLLVASSGSPELRRELHELLNDFRLDRLKTLMHDAYAQCLSQTPTLTETRIDDYISKLESIDDFPACFKESVEHVRSEENLRNFLRSQVLHGLLLELKKLFVIYGRGDERQVLVHAQLPIQFGKRGNDILTVFEAGDHGDGTTRTFQQHLLDAMRHWEQGELGECPNATEDAMIDLLFQYSDRHAEWRKLDRRDPDTLPYIIAELADPNYVDPALQRVIARVLFQSEVIGPELFYYYDLISEVRRVRDIFETELRRRASTWELVTKVVAIAVDSTVDLPNWRRLLNVYRSNIAAATEESLSPEVRLADQVQRLCGALCIDGCPACVHQESSLMQDYLQRLSVSRDLLTRYQHYLLEPKTMDIRHTELQLDHLSRVLQQYGVCWIVMTPNQLSDVSKQLQFKTTEPVFDPFRNALLLEVRQGTKS